MGLVKSGKLPVELSHTQVQVPWIRRANLLLLYRGVYDSVYDWVPGGNFYDITGNPVGGFSDLSSETRKNLRFPDNDRITIFLNLFNSPITSFIFFCWCVMFLPSPLSPRP